MLSLKDIVKEYKAGEIKVEALKGVNIAFRKNEFVAVLGPSGCGKTTLLNIIGGLDRYTSGELTINGVSTKDYTDKDLDAYRNHSVGFVFQNYNLIPHQTVLANVELALTLSGVSKSERRRRAEEALRQVGLGDQLYKKPNQISGGQMQRVAIARALVNDPDILLADEPTGALDSETSVQIMDIMKEISKDRLVIMVTHNPDLAERYSTRIVRLLDGRVISDTNPYEGEHRQADTKKRAGRTSMSFFTALSLSLNNLLTKKTRTLLTAFAGSIGIIGIALILAMSSGATAYINRVEEDTLSSYPIDIEKAAVDIGALLSSARRRSDDEISHGFDKVYSNDSMTRMINTLLAEIATNDLKAFKEFIESGESGLQPLVSDIQYAYDLDMNLYKADTSGGVYRVNPSTVLDNIPGAFGHSSGGASTPSRFSNTNVFVQLLGNQTLLNEQYDILAGRMPQRFDEVVLVVDKNNEISDYVLYSLGLKDPKELEQMFKDASEGKDIKEAQQVSFSYEELLKLTYKLVPGTDYYVNVDGVWLDRSDDELHLSKIVGSACDIKVVGVLRPSSDSVASSNTGFVGYTAALTEYLINKINDSEIVKRQKQNPDIDVFTGKPFSDGKTPSIDELDLSKLTEEQRQYLQSLSEEQRAAALENYAKSLVSDATYEGNLAILGAVDLSDPSRISIYPKDFEAKERITDIIAGYNARMEKEGKDENVIRYTDYIGLLLSSVTTIINAISYILIAFVAISLVVSSIMIGIITYISVLERTKEIGILRSIGASKKDISRVFNAETLIVGFAAGVIGIGAALLLLIPLNLIIERLSGISSLAALPAAGAVALVAISMLLTLIAGLIPSRIAAKKDPVEALRTE